MISPTANLSFGAGGYANGSGSAGGGPRRRGSVEEGTELACGTGEGGHVISAEAGTGCDP